MPQSVQCPRCQAAVSVSDDVGGTRVNCPRCEQSFVVPGFAASSDDDDWLGDDFPALAPLKPKASAPMATSSGFDDPTDFDNVEVITNPTIDEGDPDDGDPDDGDNFDITDQMEPSAKKVPVYAKEFKVRCPHCGTQTDVKADKAGKEIKCRDCHWMIRVGQPPRVHEKFKFDQDTAPNFQFTASVANQGDRAADPFRKSADELLAKASKVQDDEPPPDFDVPKIRDWAAAVFGIFFQVGVMAHWLIMSTIASTIAFFALAIDNPMLVVGLFAGGGIFAAAVLACGFAIMQSVANDEESVTDWPVTLEPMEWLAATIFCFAAAGLACFPGWFIGYVSFGNSLTTVCLTMISVFMIFPFVLLSMLDMQNIFIPFSPDVGRSVTRCEEAWGGFYFSSAIVFFFTFLIFVVADGLPAPATAVLSIFVFVGATFIYFAMLGRLAFAIGESTNAKPKENNINEIREAERKRNKV